MSRRLTLLRHAKSSWDDAALADFDRPLNDRGLRDAPRMGALLREHGHVPELVISSGAKRAIETAALVCGELDIPADSMLVTQELYLASAKEMLAVLAKLGAASANVMLVAHNPGITDLANRVSDVTIDNLPTCGCFVIDAEVDAWDDLSAQPGTLVSFDSPKKSLR